MFDPWDHQLLEDGTIWDLHDLATGLFRGSLIILDGFSQEAVDLGRKLIALPESRAMFAVPEYFDAIGVTEDGLYIAMEQARGCKGDPLCAAKEYILRMIDDVPEALRMPIRTTGCSDPENGLDCPECGVCTMTADGEWIPYDA